MPGILHVPPADNHCVTVILTQTTKIPGLWKTLRSLQTLRTVLYIL